jgi:hypothetical protein
MEYIHFLQILSFAATFIAARVRGMLVRRRFHIQPISFSTDHQDISDNSNHERDLDPMVKDI